MATEIVLLFPVALADRKSSVTNSILAPPLSLSQSVLLPRVILIHHCRCRVIAVQLAERKLIFVFYSYLNVTIYLLQLSFNANGDVKCPCAIFMDGRRQISALRVQQFSCMGCRDCVAVSNLKLFRYSCPEHPNHKTNK